MRTTGSVRERWPGVWTIRLFVGFDANGKRVDWQYVVRGTERQAHAKLKELLQRKAEVGEVAPLSRQSFGEYFTEYVETWCGDLSERTRSDLRYTLEHYIGRSLQSIKLAALTGTILQRWVNGLSARGLAPRTVGKALAEVKRSLTVAAEHGLIARNPTEHVKAPKRAHVERVRLTGEDMSAFTTAAADDPLYALFILAVFVGPRPAEVLALKWGDLADGVLTIRRSIVRGAHGKHEVSDTKTGRTRRIDLGAFELDALERHRVALAARRGLQAVAPECFMFPSATGAIAARRCGRRSEDYSGARRAREHQNDLRSLRPHAAGRSGARGRGAQRASRRRERVDLTHDPCPRMQAVNRGHYTARRKRAGNAAVPRSPEQDGYGNGRERDGAGGRGPIC